MYMYRKKGYLWMVELEIFIYFFTLPLSGHINVYHLYNRKNIRVFFLLNLRSYTNYLRDPFGSSASSDATLRVSPHWSQIVQLYSHVPIKVFLPLPLGDNPTTAHFSFKNCLQMLFFDVTLILPSELFKNDYFFSVQVEILYVRNVFLDSSVQ